MNWLSKDFNKEVDLLRSDINRLNNSRAKSLDLSKSYKEKENYVNKSKNELNKRNLSVKLAELIENDYTVKMQSIKKSLISESDVQTELLRKINKSISKSKENAFVLLFDDFIPEDLFNEKLIVFAKAHKSGELKRDIKKELNLYNIEQLSKGRIYIKDNKRTQYADIILQNEKGQILFLKRNKNDNFEPDKYCLPGGHIEPNETALAGAVRECKEETGIEIPIVDVMSIGDYIDNDSHIHYFLANVSDDTQPIVLEEREQIQYEWVDFDKIETKDLLMNLKENLTNLIGIPRTDIEDDLFKAIPIPRYPYRQDLIVFKKGNEISFCTHSDKCMDIIEKGGRRAMVGEIRTFVVGGKARKMRKMADGSWRYVGKESASSKKEDEEPSKKKDAKKEVSEEKKEDSSDSKILKRLGGSSEVTLREYNGGLSVFKKERDVAKGADQLRSEVVTDSIYGALGYEAPKSQVILDKDGVLYKESKYIDYKGIKELGVIPKSERAEFYREISKGFALDALLANWDVVGRGMDNILCYKDALGAAHVVRVDNGGALGFRAKGAVKTSFYENNGIPEITSLRETYPGDEVFADLTEEEIKQQFKDLLKKKDVILGKVSSSSLEYKALKNRFGWIENIYLAEDKTLTDTEEAPTEPKRPEEKLRADMPSLTTQRYFDDGWDELELKGNPGIKEHIKEHIIEIEHANKKEYERLANEMGLSVSLLKDMLQDLIEKVVAKSEGYIAIPSDGVLPKIFSPDGRFKSQFETKTSKGALAPYRRMDVENVYWGFVNDIEKDAEKRPIYGYMSNDKTGWSGTTSFNPKQYGDVICKIKDEKFKSAATFTVADSLNKEDDMAATPVSKPHFTSFRVFLLDKQRIRDIGDYINGKRSSLNNYIEVQYHDQLLLSDVETVKCSTRLMEFDRINQISNHLFDYVRKVPTEKQEGIDFNFEIVK